MSGEERERRMIGANLRVEGRRQIITGSSRLASSRRREKIEANLLEHSRIPRLCLSADYPMNIFMLSIGAA